MPHLLKPAYPHDTIEIIDWRGTSIQQVESLDLRELEPGRLVYFFGVHPDSRYVLKVLPEPEKRLLIMHDNDIGRLATGPLEIIISMRYDVEFNPIIKEACMIRKWMYELPNFLTGQDGRVEISYEPMRRESYTMILIQP